MGCPQSKSKKSISAVDEKGGDHGNRTRNDVIKQTKEETAPPRKTVEGHKDADDMFTRGRRFVASHLGLLHYENTPMQ